MEVWTVLWHLTVNKNLNLREMRDSFYKVIGNCAGSVLQSISYLLIAGIAISIHVFMPDSALRPLTTAFNITSKQFVMEYE